MISRIGSIVTGHFFQTVYMLGFFGKTLRAIGPFFRHTAASFKILIMQVLFTFVEALGIAAMLSIAISAAVTLLGFPLLINLNQTGIFYPLLVLIIVRELGPLLTAFVIIARSSTAIATEIAGMVVSHEVEAYISVGIDPFEHLVVPRVLGMVASMFLLNVYFIAFGFATSVISITVCNIVPPGDFVTACMQALSERDLVITLAKSIVFGICISIIATYQGFAVGRARTEVPMAGLRAVSGSFAYCIVADILLSAIFYLS